ncbi:MAG: OmpA family protein [Vampirovibrio sp.]|nr:OmpA family protein [Vampirovibrio sp.]
MGRKHKHPEHENLERWLVSYADFITLLFATFTALFAIASSEAAKHEEVAKAIRDGFHKQSIMSGIESIMSGKSAPSENPNPLSTEQGRGRGLLEKYESKTYQEGERDDAAETLEQLKDAVEQLNEELKEQLKEALEEQAKAGKNGKKTYPPGEDKPGGSGVELSVQERGLKVSFDSRLLFQPGTATLRKESLAQLDTIVKRIQKYSGRNLIQVEGHTDSQPIASAKFPSNWELSTARASQVVRLLTGKYKFDPKYMAAAGYAASRPVASNKTAEGRAKNRRIDIVIYSRVAGQKANPKYQYQRERTVVDKPKPVEQDPNLIFSKETQQSGQVRVIFQKRDEAALIKPLDVTTEVVEPEALDVATVENTPEAKEVHSAESDETDHIAGDKKHVQAIDDKHTQHNQGH